MTSVTPRAQSADPRPTGPATLETLDVAQAAGTAAAEALARAAASLAVADRWSVVDRWLGASRVTTRSGHRGVGQATADLRAAREAVVRYREALVPTGMPASSVHPISRRHALGLSLLASPVVTTPRVRSARARVDEALREVARARLAVDELRRWLV